MQQRQGIPVPDGDIVKPAKSKQGCREPSFFTKNPAPTGDEEGQMPETRRVSETVLSMARTSVRLSRSCTELNKGELRLFNQSFS